MRDAADKVERVRAATNIVHTIGAHISLRKSGKNYVGLCPFHQEKSPSFSVSADKNLYHCFGCHAGGDVFDFVMRHRGVDFHTALGLLAAQAGIELEPLSAQACAKQKAATRMAALNACARDFFAKALLHEVGQGARRYLGTRGIPAAQAKAYRLGFGHASPTFFAYLAHHGFSATEAGEAGLLSEDGRRHLFDGRVIFPIVDGDAKVCGFGGRRLDDRANTPKYINTRDGGLFAKRCLLYGFFEARGAIRQHRKVVLVEGYTDVLAAHRSGVQEAVAVLGTAFTPEHAHLLGRLVHEAVVLLDADAAGLRAARQSCLALLAAKIQTQVATMPAGEDPASLVQKGGAAALREVVHKAQPALAFFMDRALPGGDSSIETKVAAAAAVQPFLQALGPGLERDLYTERFSTRIGLPPELLDKHLRQSPKPGLRGVQRRHHDQVPTPRVVRQPPESLASQPLAAEIELLRELLLFPTLRAQFGEIADFAKTPAMQDMLAKLAESQQSVAEVIEICVTNINWQKKLLAVRPLPADALEGDAQRGRRTFAAVLCRFKALHVDAALKEVIREIQQAESRGDATESLMRRKQELAGRKRALLDGLPGADI